ncbi:carbohydrate ABC transporter permease [Candidatus Planktophila dulcis]|uniref:carbohydrate ABC transporter permease n=1 Tax=Candidatus Planktophila dulcis TaxID=1884914 RepID=UPI003CF1E6AD
MGSPSVKGFRRDRQGKIAMLLLLPTFIGFSLFYIYPTARGIMLSFTNTIDLGSPGENVGFENYIKVFQDPIFWNAIRVTLQYVAINIGSQTIIALGLAVAMDRLTTKTWIRIALLMPWLIPGVSAAMLYRWMLNPLIGVFNQFLALFGHPGFLFFGSETMAMPTVALVNTWRFVGYTSLLIYAGIQMIPKSLYEAGSLDGATEWKLFTRITMPLLRPVLVMVMIVSFIGSFQIFDTMVIATDGGPMNSTRAINYYIFEKAFEQYKIGYAAAMATLLLIFLAILSIIQLRIARAGDSDLSNA